MNTRAATVWVMTLLASVTSAAASTANFNDLAEDFYGPTLTVDGIRFESPFDGFDPGQWAADQAGDFWPTVAPMLDYVDGGVLTINGYTDGPSGVLFTSVKSFEITSDKVETFGQMSFAYIAGDAQNDWTDNTVTLEALLGGQVVATDSAQTDNVLAQAPKGTSLLGAARLTIDGVAFDRLRFSVSGPSLGGRMLGVIDNVTLAPEPGSALLLALGALGMRRRA